MVVEWCVRFHDPVITRQSHSGSRKDDRPVRDRSDASIVTPDSLTYNFLPILHSVRSCEDFPIVRSDLKTDLTLPR